MRYRIPSGCLGSGAYAPAATARIRLGKYSPRPTPARISASPRLRRARSHRVKIGTILRCDDPRDGLDPRAPPQRPPNPDVNPTLSALNLPFQYVAVDGPIGVGKTTLVEMLVRRFEGVKVLEDVDNPFLGKFYRDRPGAAFQTELYFLLSRYKQQQSTVQRELFQRLLVADYTFQKNRIFAYLNLSDDELMLFDKLYNLLQPQVPVPELVLYLVADVDTCMERIRKRGREVEKNISRDYLRELIDAYNHYYHYYDRSPLLVVDTRHLDFPNREEDFQHLVHQLTRPIKGTQYFVVGAP